MRRVPTFVDGLDEVLEGGVPAGSVVLVSGAPGTMKTSLTFNVLHHNARRGTKGVYVSLEQSRESLLEHTAGLGLRLEDAGGNLSVLDLAALRKKLPDPQGQPWLDLFKFYAVGLKKTFDYKVLVIDSLDALEILAKFRDVRRDVFGLIAWLRSLECTAFLLAELASEVTEDPVQRTSFATHKEEYLADGIWHLRMVKQGQFGIQRQLRVVKMRGTRHDTSYHALVFEDGFRVTRIMM
ncbi:MAG TPA: ATPase domain-containing protein [Thermoplasmata archaeon]|nr:ATPase domain-containing protein [Thermoplasmata archaeon]